jgi:hypothetical protein
MNVEIIAETPSDESIHAQQEQLEQWVIDLLEGREPEFWWVY